MKSSVPLKFFHAVPYSDPPSRLRTVDLWLPEHHDKDPSSLPWIIYIHGGAWRDPLIKVTDSMIPTVSHLASSHASTLSQMGGIASLDYRLSPYPRHKTHPSDAADPDRNCTHPQHVCDIAQAMQFLQRKHNIKRWIGVGHSCGATMLLHLIANVGLEPASYTLIKPEAALLLAGIYDFPLMLQNHTVPTYPAEFARIYEELFESAFGADRSVYQSLSPVSLKLDREQWPEGKLAVLAYSSEDELIEEQQRDVMCAALEGQGWSIVKEEGAEENDVRAEGKRMVKLRDIKGSHDDVWKDGKQIATIVAEVVQRLG